MNHETKEATELAAWLDNHVRHLQTLQVNLDVMPSTEIVLFSRIAELLRQQGAAPAPADEGAPISLVNGGSSR